MEHITTQRLAEKIDEAIRYLKGPPQWGARADGDAIQITADGEPHGYWKPEGSKYRYVSDFESAEASPDDIVRKTEQFAMRYPQPVKSS